MGRIEYVNPAFEAATGYSRPRRILHLFVEVTRTIEQEDFEGWLKNRLLGGS